MSVLSPRHSQEEFARLGEAIYERDIRNSVEAEHAGEMVAIDIESGAYEVDRDDYAASERLLARVPDAQIWLMRVGFRTAYRIGAHPRPGRS